MSLDSVKNIKTTEKIRKKRESKTVFDQKPTSAFIGASWAILIIGFSAYCIGLWNSEMLLNEKGYYFTVILFALFSVISVQKSVRDKLEGIQITELYYGLSWCTTIISLVLLVVGLWNADLLLSEKGFYAMSFLLSIFGAISVQKNTRDIEYIKVQQSKIQEEV